MTLARWLAEASRQLTAAGRDERESRQDLAALARWHLGWTAARWLADQRDQAPAGFVEAIAPLVARRERGEPVAYLTGEREFYGRTFRVTPVVLIPRPETELVVSEALACLAGLASGVTSPPVVVDVGTGSGCIAVTMAIERPVARVIATDVSPDALGVAEDNARRLGVADRIAFHHGSLLAGVDAPVDLIVSNPPYVAIVDRASLIVDVERYEPAVALFGGNDGLDVIRGLMPAAAAALRPGGWLVMEIGLGQADAVRRLLEADQTWSAIRVLPDLQQIPRVVVARVTSFSSGASSPDASSGVAAGPAAGRS